MQEIKLKPGISDFGFKNVLLIASIALVLGLLAWNQRPIRLANIDTAARKFAANNAKVLGANTVSAEIQKQIEAISIRTSADNSSKAFQNYIAQLGIVSQADRLDTLLNGAQQDAKTESRQQKFIEDIQKIAVPSALGDYHRLFLAYYSMAFSALKTPADPGAEAVLSVFADELQKQRSGFKTSAGIALP